MLILKTTKGYFVAKRRGYDAWYRFLTMPLICLVLMLSVSFRNVPEPPAPERMTKIWVKRKCWFVPMYL